MRVDQVVVSAVPGDAVTDFARTLQAALSETARSDIYALYYDDRLRGQVCPLDRYGKRRDARPGSDVVVFHLSIGEPQVTRFIAERPERVVLVYHNISPSEAFRPYDPGFADLLDEGRETLRSLRPHVAAAFTVSEFNAAEMRQAGYREVRVLPLLLDTHALRATVPDPVVDAQLAAEADGPLVLSVGQVLPHKRPDFLIEAFHILSTYLLPDSRLVLVGPARLPGYKEVLCTQIEELHLSRISMTGAVPRDVLAAYFRRADVLATASEHEGFCAPLVEAMSFDLPFVGRRFSAIPETAGGAGLLLDPGDGPAVAAEALAAVLTDPALRTALVARGRARVRDFDIGRATASWRDELLLLA